RPGWYGARDDAPPRSRMSSSRRTLATFAMVAMLGGCTESTLEVPGAPIGCDPMGGAVTGSLIDADGLKTAFGPVTATLSAPTEVTLTDGVLALEIGIGTAPRDFTLVFPGRPVFAINGKVVIDEESTCHAGRFDAVFQFHGELTGWFAVP